MQDDNDIKAEIQASVAAYRADHKLILEHICATLGLVPEPKEKMPDPRRFHADQKKYGRAWFDCLYETEQEEERQYRYKQRKEKWAQSMGL